jgi:hypothetical protein
MLCSSQTCLKAILYSIDPLFSAIFLNKESIRLWSSATIGNCPARISTAAVDVNVFHSRVGAYILKVKAKNSVE